MTAAVGIALCFFVPPAFSFTSFGPPLLDRCWTSASKALQRSTLPTALLSCRLSTPFSSGSRAWINVERLCRMPICMYTAEQDDVKIYDLTRKKSACVRWNKKCECDDEICYVLFTYDIDD
uniref:Secreted protein n=1 Tax=Anopheles culicifacies TaxID=139723 RepID=A0A182MLU9_9DIPT